MGTDAVGLMNRSWGYICSAPKTEKPPTADTHEKYVREKKLNFFERTTPAQTISYVGTILSGIAAIFGFNSDNTAVSWGSKILLGIGIAASLIFGIGYNWEDKDSVLGKVRRFLSGEDNDEKYKAKIIDKAAEAIYKHVGGDKDKIIDALNNPNSEHKALLDNVIEIKHTAKKDDASHATIQTILHIRKADGLNSKIELEAEKIDWDFLPSEIRRDFINKGGQPQSYTIYPFPKEESKPVEPPAGDKK